MGGVCGSTRSGMIAAEQSAAEGSHSAAAPDLKNKALKVRIFSINDIYKLDNMSRLQTCILKYNRENPVDKTYLTLNGDIIGGCLLFNLDKGKSPVDIANKMGFDFMCLGNHEFDHGRSELESRISEFKGRWLNCNVDCDDDASEINKMPKHHIETLPNGCRIAWFGVCTTDSPSLSTKDPTTEGITFLDVKSKTVEVIKHLRGAGTEDDEERVHAVIALTHQNNDEDKWMLEAGVDVVLGGHDHVAWSARGGPTGEGIAVKCGLDCENVDVLEFTAHPAGAGETESKSSLFKLDKHTLVVLESKTPGVRGGFPPDPEIQKLIDQHKKILNLNNFSLFSWKDFDDRLKVWGKKHDPDQATCWTTQNIRERQCNFYSLVAEWLKHELVDPKKHKETICLINSGNFRANADYDFSEKMTFTDMQKELAFDNSVIKLRLTGAEVLDLLRESEVKRKGQGGYLQYDRESIKLRVDENLSAVLSHEEALDVTIESINGEPWEADKLYTNITVSKQLDGMDNWAVLTKHGERIGKKVVKQIIDSAPGMQMLVVNAILKAKWEKMDRLWGLKDTFIEKGASLNLESLCEKLKAAGELSEDDETMVKMMFDILDVNKDGKIDAAELGLITQGHKQFRGTIDPHAAQSDLEKFRSISASSNPGSQQDSTVDTNASTMVSWPVLEKQDDVATASAIKYLEQEEGFLKLANSETEDILNRDAQDAEALKKGIKFAQDKGVLEVIEPEPYTDIDVLGKTADEVAAEMITKLGDSAQSGCVLVLVGLSGTGKGTTVDKLKAKLTKAVTWSNGNIFRCLTVMACDYSEQTGEELASVLTPENLKNWIGKLTFDKFNGKWDTQLMRLDGSTVLVSEVANTLLKEPRISKNIPTVAQTTQGEVVLFAGDACTKMGADGSVVIVEGREDTVNFIPTPFRFRLMLSDTQIIGKRRAAQRVVAQALKDCANRDEDACAFLQSCVGKLAA